LIQVLSDAKANSNSEHHMHPRILEVTERIARRSAGTRRAYLDHIRAAVERASGKVPAAIHVTPEAADRGRSPRCAAAI
jgi:hypothetical protein